jgi:hypothetical protein
LVCLETVLVLMQDRCSVCAKCTIGSEIILGAPDGTVMILKWKLDSVHLEIVLILVHDRCTLCAEHAIGS